MNPRITKTSDLGVLDGIEGEFLPCHHDEGTTETSWHSKHRCRSGSERLDCKPDSTGVVEVQPVGKRFVSGERVWLHPGHHLQVGRNVLALLSGRPEPTFA